MTTEHPSEPVEDLLRRAAQSIVPSDDLEARVANGIVRVGRRRRNRRIVAVILVTVVVSAAGWVLRPGPADERSPVVDVAAGPSTRPDGSDRPLAPVAAAPGGTGELGSARWVDVAPPPVTAREGAAWANSDRHLVVWGGRSLDTTELTNDGAYFDASTGRWSLIPAVPDVPGRWNAGAVVVGDHAYVVGGAVDRADGPVRTLEISLTDGTVTVLGGDQPEATQRPLVLAVDGELIALGGEGPNGVVTRGVEVFDLDGRDWSVAEDLPWPVTADRFNRTDTTHAAVSPDGTEVTVVIPDAAEPHRLSIATYDVVERRATSVVDLDLTERSSQDSTIATDGYIASYQGPDAVVLVDVGEPDIARSLDRSGTVRWQVEHELEACEGPTTSTTVGLVTYVQGPCGEVVAIDHDGAVTSLASTGIEAGSVPALVSLGDSLLLVDFAIPPGYANAPEQPATVLALTVGDADVPAAGDEGPAESKFDRLVNGAKEPFAITVSAPPGTNYADLTPSGDGGTLFTAQQGEVITSVCSAGACPVERGELLRTVEVEGVTFEVWMQAGLDKPAPGSEPVPDDIRSWWATIEFTSERPAWLTDNYGVGEGLHPPTSGD